MDEALWGNVSRAANALGITQPALTARLQSLEQELGQPLFVRTRRGVQLTDAGLAFLQVAGEPRFVADAGERLRVLLPHLQMPRFFNRRPPEIFGRLVDRRSDRQPRGAGAFGQFVHAHGGAHVRPGLHRAAHDLRSIVCREKRAHGGVRRLGRGWLR